MASSMSLCIMSPVDGRGFHYSPCFLRDDIKQTEPKALEGLVGSCTWMLREHCDDAARKEQRHREEGGGHKRAHQNVRVHNCLHGVMWGSLYTMYYTRRPKALVGLFGRDLVGGTS